MADIDRRVRVLTDILMDRGFGWLAAEIIDAIEAGRNDASDRDPHVTAQRAALNQRLLKGDANPASSPESLKHSASRPAHSGERMSADDQVFVAVDLFVDRLTSAAEMTAKSVDALSTFMNAPVSLYVETEGEIRAVLPAKARESALRLGGVKNELIEWLISVSPPEEA
jgi:hypothetical protein